MKKFILSVVLMLGVMATKAQMVSVQGGNLTYRGKNYGFSQLEVSGHITKDLSAVGSYSKVLEGYDVSTVALRHSAFKNSWGFTLGGAYLQNNTFQPIFGVDLKVSEQVRVAFTSSFNNKLRLIGLKVPVYQYRK